MPNKTQTEETLNSNPARERGSVMSFLLTGSLVSPVDAVLAVPVGFGVHSLLGIAAEAFVMNHPVGAAAICAGSALGLTRGGRGLVASLVRRSREKQEGAQ